MVSPHTATIIRARNEEKQRAAINYTHNHPAIRSLTGFDASPRLLHFADPLVPKCQRLQTGALPWKLLQTSIRFLSSA